MVSAEGNAVGFLFGYPLRAGTPTSHANKILWVMRAPRNGAVLSIDSHPVGAAAPSGHAESPADSYPGEIYPSNVDEPRSGCWHLTLTWNGSTATLDLPYGDSAN